jgi:hypothetical protein
MIKHDSGKRRWSLLPWREVGIVVDVIDAGARKYAVNNWKQIEPRSLLFDALMRHVTAWHKGERDDEEDGLPHLAHAVCCALFLMWFDEEERS